MLWLRLNELCACAQILAGRCTEVAMGDDRTLTEIIQQEIFDKLDMQNAGWGVHEADPRVLPMYRCECFHLCCNAAPK